MTNPIEKTEIRVPIEGGLNTGADPYKLEPPALAKLKNAILETDELRGRFSYTEFTTTGYPAVAIRKVVANGDELIAFTPTEIYSYSPGNDPAGSGRDTWVSRGEWPATYVQQTAYGPGSEGMINPDRAQCQGLIWYAWETYAATGNVVWLSAIDADTKAVRVTPISQGTGTRPRLVTLTGSNKVLIFYQASTGNLVGKALDASSPTTAAAAAFSVISASAGGPFDVEAYDGTTVVLVHILGSGAYEFRTIDSTLATTVGPTTGSADVQSVSVATISSPVTRIAVFYQRNPAGPTNDTVEASVYDTAHTLQGSQTLVSGVGGIVGANPIACAFRTTVVSGKYRCYAYWYDAVSTATTQTAWIAHDGATSSALATDFDLYNVYRPASRAFRYGGNVFAWFTPHVLDKTFTQGYTHALLVRQDGLVVAKAAYDNGVNAGAEWGTTTGILPGVETLTVTTDDSRHSTQEFACALSAARFIVGGYKQVFTQDTLVAFDHDFARRALRFGQSLYITGGIVGCYDGQSVVEVGFHSPPSCTVVDAATGVGNLQTGNYSWAVSTAWQNASGEIDRSGAFALVTAAITGPDKANVTITYPVGTNKTATFGRSEVRVDLWRTALNPPDSAPAKLVSSNNPVNAVIRSRAAGTVLFVDNAADPLATEPFPYNSDILEHLAPPAATIIASVNDRLFLAGFPGDPDTVWYSKPRVYGEVAAFNSVLSFTVPTGAGSVTGVAELSGQLVVFRENQILVAGSIDGGLSNTGAGDNFGPFNVISPNVGCVNPESIVRLPIGLFFLGTRGPYLLGTDFSIQYLGLPLEGYRDFGFYEAVTLTDRELVLLRGGEDASDYNIFAWDYRNNRWSNWAMAEVSTLNGQCLWQDKHVIADSFTGTVLYQDETKFPSTLLWETPWLQLGPVGSYQAIDEIVVTGRWEAAHNLNWVVYQDFNDTTPAQSSAWTATPAVAGPEVLQIRLSQPKCHAVKIQVADSNGKSVISSLTLRVARKAGLTKLPSAQRQ